MAIPSEVPRKQRIYALCIAIFAIASLCLDPSLSNAVGMGGLLLIAWREAFVPSPSVRLRMRQIYGEYRSSGRVSTRTEKAVTIAGIVLVLASFVLKFSGSG